MKKTLFIASSGALLALLLSPVAREAEAGAVSPSTHGCSTPKGLAGYCWGTLRGYRQAANATTYARIDTAFKSGKVERYFAAQYNNAAWGCTIVEPYAPGDAWSLLMANPDLRFTLSWTTDGACNLINLAADSGHL